MKTKMTPEQTRLRRNECARARYAGSSVARSKKKAYDAAKYAANRGASLAHTKEWREAHPGYMKAWANDHKEAVRKSQKKSKSKNKEKIKKTWQAWWKRRGSAWTRMNKYGISQEEFDRIAKAQQYRCACCGKKPEKLVVDHCHKRNHFRGLICGKCNTAAGLVGDTATGALALYRYLLKTRLPENERGEQLSLDITSSEC